MSLITINDSWGHQEYEEILKSTSDRLWRFIQQHASLVDKNNLLENITGLNEHQIRTLSSTHLLLSDEVTKLVDIIAPSILRRISKSSRISTSIERGRIKGKVNWNRTVLKQTTEMDPSIFVCVNRSSIFDLIENKVLLFCLRYIYQIGQGVIGTELPPDESTSEDYLAEHKKWIKKVEYILFKCRKLLKNPLLKNITELHGINSQQIERTRKARGVDYKSLADIAELISMQRNQPLDFLYHAFSKQILVPMSRDTLYEVAVAFKVIDFYTECGWIEERISLIGEKEKILSVLKKGNAKLNIFYQHIPSHFAEHSKYKELMKETKLSIHHRRPDIILEWINGQGEKRYTIVEVKRSKNRGYLADGIYKILGYIKDFEISLQNSADSVGLLVGWEIKGLQAPKGNKEVYASGWEALPLFLYQLEENLIEFLVDNPQQKNS
ncbi:hypothetical protein [Sporosarcina sp. P7]|uniref:hypothetical protein n=1 Tax=Sporosarcina sp. P7 TaxID=2048244 RepID=UPI000C16DCEA|nr:hypothetical protein [Sporosarcina sp. P7]PID23761.1 hypothetical protein CSV60_12790 [Sporosarcina sp. P7]